MTPEEFEKNLWDYAKMSLLDDARFTSDHSMRRHKLQEDLKSAYRGLYDIANPPKPTIGAFERPTE
jgi:hypothetical protein